MLCNPHSIILFSSKQPSNITKNARLADISDFDKQALRFYEAVQAEQPVILLSETTT